MMCYNENKLGRFTMEINEKVKSVKVYEVEGKEFKDKQKAEEYLANLKKELNFTY